MIRVTQGMMQSKFMRNLNNNLHRMDKLQEQTATTKKINRPSDDPVGLTYALRYRSEIVENEQYQANADITLSWLDHADTAMDQAGKVLDRIRVLTVNASNSSNPPSAMDAISSEMNQLLDQLVEVGNKQFNGKYIFNGQMTDIKPYTTATAETVNTNPDSIMTEIGPDVKMPINVTGQTIFGTNTDTDNAFKVVKDIIGLVDLKDHTALTSQIDILEGRIGKVLHARTDVGAKYNRTELAQNRLADSEVNLTALQSKVEDADMAAVITNLKTQENVYNASLSVGAKILRPSLVDFLN